MYAACTTERAALRQRQLTNCLLDTLQTLPFSEVSVSQLCRDTGVSRKQFYQLFSNKQDVLIALVDQVMLDYGGYDTPSGIGPGEFHRCLAYWKEQKPFLDALESNQMTALLTDRSMRHVLTEDTAMQKLFGANNPNVCAEMMLFYMSGILSLVFYWHRTGYEKSIDEMCAILNTLMQKTPVEPYT